MIVGIDYGAKLAGTTALAWIEGTSVLLTQSDKKKDADAFILDFIDDRKPTYVFIDAPLSIPPAFTNATSSEYFYRQADRELAAMSPMFIGGLTARAMRMKKLLEAKSIEVFETYPAALNRKVIQAESYKKDLVVFTEVIDMLLKGYEVKLKVKPITWHQIDAVLALLSALRWQRGEHLIFGNVEEGQIVV
jgi:uncharacterized protein